MGLSWMGAGSIRTLPLLSVWRRYLAPSKDAFAPKMVKPGARGYGIIPWVMDVDSCGCGSEHPLAELTWGDPCIVPAFVSWVSPLGTTEEIRPEVEETFGLEEVKDSNDLTDVTSPVLVLDKLVFPDMHSTCERSVRQQGLESIEYSLEFGYRNALLAPAWLVTPVASRMWHNWAKESKRYWSEEMPWLDIYDVLTSAEIMYDEEDAAQMTGMTEGELKSQFDAMQTAFMGGADFAAGIETEQAAFEDAFSTALERARFGWQLCHGQASEGDSSSDYFGGWWSPYWRIDAMTAQEKASVRAQRAANRKARQAAPVS